MAALAPPEDNGGIQSAGVRFIITVCEIPIFEFSPADSMPKMNACANRTQTAIPRESARRAASRIITTRLTTVDRDGSVHLRNHPGLSSEAAGTIVLVVQVLHAIGAASFPADDLLPSDRRLV